MNYLVQIIQSIILDPVQFEETSLSSSSSTATVAPTRSEDSKISQRSSRFTQSDDSKATVGAFSIHFTDGSTPSTMAASNSERFRVVPARNNPAYQHDDDFS